MRGKNEARPHGLSTGNESMCLYSEDPLMQGLALFGNGGLLLSHTPPNFTPGSYEVSHMKRARAGSISGRLRSASDLEEKGLIDKSQKGVLKDLIISGDSELQAALDLYDNGDSSKMEALMESGLLDRRDSLDLLQDLDFGIMDLGMSDDETNFAVDTVGVGGREMRPGVTDQPADATGVPRSMTTRSATGGISTAGGCGGGNVEVSLPGGDGVRVGGLAVANFGGGGGHRDGGAVGGGGGPAGSEYGQHASGIGVGVGVGVDSEPGIDLGADVHGHFDIGDMAFDTTFEHDYAEQEDDVDMKNEGGQIPSASGGAATSGAHGSLGTAVGPLRVVATSELAPSHLGTNGDEDAARRPAGLEDSDATERVVDRRGIANGAGGVDGHADADADATGLGSFSTLGAVIGDFSPQFKFSFTDDIHLDLGGGLKDELRDLESFSGPLPDHHSKGVDILGMPAGHVGALSSSPRVQLLSRGGPAVVKSEMTAAATTGAGATTTTTTMMMAPGGGSRGSAARSDAAVAGAGGGSGAASAADAGYTSNHYSSAAAYKNSGRHMGPYATTTMAATAKAKAKTSTSASASSTSSGRPHGSGAQGGGVYGGGGGGEGGHVATTHHAARGRPVVSGMGVMVGGGPRKPMGGMGAGGDEERKFVGAYSPEARRQRIQRFLQKREHRVWTKMVKYDVRKNFADTRMRVKGRFVKKEDEALLREVMACA